MKTQAAAFLRTTLPLDLAALEQMDSGRYHSIWLPDHMVSFWPDAIWTPEFTDLATVSPSPHRHLDGMAVAAAVAVLTKNVPIATCVVDTVRRNPAMLAQAALTIDHLSKGRFIMGLGAGEMENCLPYGFEFHKPVSRFEECLKVMNLLWESDGPVNFEGEFFKLHNARMDTELYEGKKPPVWIGAAGPRMLGLTGRHADGWWPAGTSSPEDYGMKLETLREAAEQAGRDPMAITPALIVAGLIGDDAEIAEMIEAPLVKAYILQLPGQMVREAGFSHPMGDDWKGIHDLDPGALTREMLVDILAKISPEMILAVVPHGSPEKVAQIFKNYADAGMRVPKILDYGGMAGLKFGARSPEKVRQTEDEFVRLTTDCA